MADASSREARRVTRARGQRSPSFGRERFLRAMPTSRELVPQTECLLGVTFVVSASVLIVLQKSQNALPLIFRERRIQAPIADQWSLKPVTEIACEFIVR